MREGREGPSRYEGAVVREGSFSCQDLSGRAASINVEDQDGGQE